MASFDSYALVLVRTIRYPDFRLMRDKDYKLPKETLENLNLYPELAYRAIKPADQDIIYLVQLVSHEEQEKHCKNFVSERENG